MALSPNIYARITHRCPTLSAHAKADRVDNMQRPPGIAWHMHLVNLLVNDHQFNF